jgi:hypothetical protein
MKEKPVFVTGASQTGKSLLARLLRQHTNIAFFTQEDRFWQLFYGEFGDLSQPDNFERYFDALLRYSRGLGFSHEEMLIRESLSQKPKSYLRLYASFQEDYARQVGRPRWGVHSDGPQNYVEPILQQFSGAKFIHIIRDPRDRWVSMKNPTGTQPTGFKKWGRLGAEMGAWLRSVSYAKSNRKRFPHAYLVVPYESLCQEPAETLHRVREFVDAFDDAPSEEKVPREEHVLLAKDLDFKDVSAAYVGCYARELLPQETAHIQHQARDDMERLGYEMEPVRLSAREHLRFHILDRWLHLARRQVGRLVRRRMNNRRALAQVGSDADIVRPT